MPNAIHGSIVTQASTIQPLMVPPQNSHGIYLVDEINIPQNSLVHLLPLNTLIFTQDTHKRQFEIQSHIKDSPNGLPIYPSSKSNNQQ